MRICFALALFALACGDDATPAIDAASETGSDGSADVGADAVADQQRPDESLVNDGAIDERIADEALDAPDTAVPDSPPPRLLVVHIPYGVFDEDWYPTGEGMDFSLSEMLAPLERHRDELTFLRGLDVVLPEGLESNFSARTHTPALLTGALGDEVREGSGVRFGGAPSIDHVLASNVTPLRTLNYLLPRTAGIPADRPMMASWRTPNELAVPENGPERAFERIASELPDGSPFDIAGVAAQIDALGTAGNTFMQADLDAFLAIVANAFAADVARSATIQLSVNGDMNLEDLDQSVLRMFRGPKDVDGRAIIRRYYMQLADSLARFLDRLAETPAGDGTLLEHTLVLWISEGGDPSTPRPGTDIGAMLLGNVNDGLNAGRLVDVDASHVDLLLTIAQLFDRSIDSFGDPALGATPIESLLSDRR
ncbi:MAG: DUF1552 domain-containing protein [Myxococcota bacterium]